jgi:2-polyprenyl-6-methoxyphenol hydroxylase-like FAD-dependent oxidoreductase
VVVGGGPAGATVARQLSLWGYAVTLFAKPEPVRPALAESLPPSCRQLFDRLGILEAVDGAGFLESRGNTVCWGTSRPRAEPFAEGMYGYQVERGAYDRMLLDLARVAGTTIVPSLVREVEVSDDVVVTYDHEGTVGRIGTSFVLDCSGRSGIVARQGFRSHEDGYRTLALAGVWSREGGWDLPDDTHTIVESYGDGWGWSVPLANGRRYVTVMVDPTVTDLARQDVSILYQSELLKTHHLRNLVEAATPIGPPWACDASVYTATQFCGSGFLLVGDAASFIDPLASFGVKKAMASAWIAAVVTNTCLTNPAMATAAMAFYDAHERRVYASYREFASRFYHDAATTYPYPFWEGRAIAPDGLSAGTDIESLRHDRAVLAAFEALKQSSSIELVESAGTKRVREPAIRGREVVLEDQLLGPGSSSALRYLRGVDLLRLVRLAGEHRQVPDLFDAYNREGRPVILPDFLGALSVLLATGMLENRISSGKGAVPSRDV